MLKVTRLPKEKIIYPVARRSQEYRFIVLFVSERDSVVIDPAKSGLKSGDRYSDHCPCNSPFWEPLDITITG